MKYDENVDAKATVRVIIVVIVLSISHSSSFECKSPLIIVVTPIHREITVAFNMNALKYEFALN